MAPYLTLCREDPPLREHSLRVVFNGPRHIVSTGNQWRFMPGDLPSWRADYQQTPRCHAGRGLRDPGRGYVFAVARVRRTKPQPRAMIVVSRKLHSTPESGTRPGYDCAERCKGSKVHAAVDTLGHLLALHVAVANEQ